MRVLSQGDGLIQHRAQPESNLTPDNGTAGWDLQVRFPSIAELGGVPRDGPFPPHAPPNSVLLCWVLIAAHCCSCSCTELCAEPRSSACSAALS